jgi:hypothetical protein
MVYRFPPRYLRKYVQEGVRLTRTCATGPGFPANKLLYVKCRHGLIGSGLCNKYFDMISAAFFSPATCTVPERRTAGLLYCTTKITSTNDTQLARGSQFPHAGRARKRCAFCPSGCTHCYLCQNTFTTTAPIFQRGPIISYSSPRARPIHIAPDTVSAVLLSVTLFLLSIPVLALIMDYSAYTHMQPQ